jgi:GrpB-like predicted nucleotidyltransferase (UPF0157 family)
MSITVIDPDPDWPERFVEVAAALRDALAGVSVVAIEHVGSTAVPQLAAKPIIDIDVIVERADVGVAIEALKAVGYVHRGDLGVTDREAFDAPDDTPRRNVYVCVAGTLHVRNHLAVRDILRARPDLRDRYGAVKRELAADAAMDIDRYLAGKSAILQEVLALSDLSESEKMAILQLNTGG